jgi:cytochrome c biogenesis protein CcmG, thiol:disulfide interchange protein DsbE
MRTLRWLLVPLVVVPVAWLFLQGLGRATEVPSAVLGRTAPAWELPTLDGGTLGSADLAGRPYVVNFWASWCIPACVDEHPVLAAAHDRWGDELVVIGVLYQDAAGDARDFLARYGDAGYDHVVDENGTLAVEFGVTGPPETFFIGADGTIRDKQFGPLTEATMERRVASILLRAAP